MPVSLKEILNSPAQTLKSKFFWSLALSFLLFVFLSFLYLTLDPQKYEIILTESGFEPESLNIHVGDLVIFKTTRGDSFWPASDPHPLHDLYPAFDAKKPIRPGETWTFKAKNVGVWNYHDHLFPAFRGHLSVLSKSDLTLPVNPPKKSEINSWVNRLGPETAYQKFKKDYSQVENGLSHTGSHLFGEVLYDTLGITGISICDSAFGFGCFHGLFVRAISDKGVSVVNDLDQECLKKFGSLGLGCPHGIGHGLGEFFGPLKLNEQLAICKTLSWKGPLFGCVGGVFMEHNFPTGFNEGKESVQTIRQPVDSQYYEPCYSVAKEFRKSCFFEQASWWREIFQADYHKIGQLCNGIISSSEKEACLEGAGNVAVESSSYNLEESISACSKMPSKYTEAYCRIGVSWAFFANPSQSHYSEKACQGLDSFENLCLKKRILVGGQNQSN